MQDLVSAVRAGLAEVGDPERAVGQQRYMKSAMPYRGVTSPQVDRGGIPPALPNHFRPARTLIPRHAEASWIEDPDPIASQNRR